MDWFSGNGIKNSSSTKEFVYFPQPEKNDVGQQQNIQQEQQQEQNISNDMLDKLLKTVGREV